MTSLLDQASAQAARQKQQLPPSNPWSLLRNAFASLVLAIGFAALARRRRSKQSLLSELQHSWQRLQLARLRLRRRLRLSRRRGR